MSLSVNIQQLPKQYEEVIKLCKAEDVFNLKEVQEIKNAVQEHFLFIGMDRKNHIKEINLLGVGSSGAIIIDSKYIIRNALISASDKVILVHNHPSNSLKPSNEDLHMTNITNQILKAFNIELIDHVIVCENGYISMGKENKIDRDYEDNTISNMNKGLLIEENQRLQMEIEKLQLKSHKNLKKKEEQSEEYEF